MQIAASYQEYNVYQRCMLWEIVQGGVSLRRSNKFRQCAVLLYSYIIAWLQNACNKQREKSERALGGTGIRDFDGEMGCSHRGLDEIERDHWFQHLCTHLGAITTTQLAHALVIVHLLQPWQWAQSDNWPFLPGQACFWLQKFSSCCMANYLHTISSSNCI